MDERAKLMSKIDKLMGMASSPNPHEAAAFLAKAQDLLAQHNLAMTDVEAASLDHVSIKSPFSVSKLKPYENTLAWAVAEAFGCTYFWQPSKSKSDDIYARVIFVGKKSDVKVAEHFFIVLQRKLLTGRAEYVRTLGNVSAKTKTVEGDGWCIGYARAIRGSLSAVASKPSKVAVDQYAASCFDFKGGEAEICARQAGTRGLAHGDLAGSKERLYHAAGTDQAAKQIGG